MKGITTFIKHNQDKQTIAIINVFLDIKMSLLKLLVTVGILLAIAVCTANAITVSLTHAMILLNFKCACFILLYSFLQQCCVSPTGRGLIPIKAPVEDCSQYQDEEWCGEFAQV